MFLFQRGLIILLVAVVVTEASVVAPAVAGPVAYTQAIPYNIPPFAASISTFSKALALPPVVAPAPLAALPPPAGFLPAPLAAAPPNPFLPGPLAAAALPAPFLPGSAPVLSAPFPLAARSIHPAVPAFPALPPPLPPAFAAPYFGK